MLGLHERPAAELFGVSYPKLNNTTSGKITLDHNFALQIQAATGVSAASLMKGESPPVMLNGGPISRELFELWKITPVSEESRKNQLEELSLMTKILLEATGERPHFRRRTYHLLRSLLEEMRKSSGISEAEINQAAAKIGTELTSYETTRKKLDQADLGRAPEYLAIRECLSAKGPIEVIQEAFFTWGEEELINPNLVLDSRRSLRVTYRLKGKKNQWYQVTESRCQVTAII